MYTVIIGGGIVGTYLARVLSHEGHDVALADSSERVIDQLEETLDVKLAVGNGASLGILKELGAERADLLLAVSGNDEINLLACLTAKRMGTKRTVARARNEDYARGKNLSYASIAGIDRLICPERLTSNAITNLLLTPGAVAVEKLAGGRVQLRTLPVTANSPLAGKALRDIKLPQSTLIVAIERESKALIPSGDDSLETGDQAFVLGQPDQLSEVAGMFGALTSSVRRVVVLGGGQIGFSIAKSLEAHDPNVRLIERNRNRCRALSETLSKTVVLNGDGTDMNLLREERVATADAFVAVSGVDSTNILSGLLSKELGVKTSIVLIERPEYLPLIERLGIDQAVSPRILAGQEIMQFVRRGQVSSAVVLGEQVAEILEIVARPSSKVMGRPLSEVSFPKGAIAAVIVSEDRVVVPTGDYVTKDGDLVIVFAMPDAIPKVEKLFRVKK
ncbi:MAG: Trk system potassium transporter TrkA [Candidatus Eisenbacteria sp.]|nr:Trk system potassium transporter TrkA [Candidatus Eisenbacteria bacterium]